jgi:hypothetical protein
MLTLVGDLVNRTIGQETTVTSRAGYQQKRDRPQGRSLSKEGKD